MHLYDLIDVDEIRWLADNAYLREVFHPTEPLGLLNYTDRAMTKPEIFADYESLNRCRGLIWNTATGEVVARPFRKFWNHGQSEAAKIRLDEPVNVIDKVDGSLGILYREPNSGQLAIATRGSFTSDQAVHATGLFRTKYAGEVPDDETFLFEIVYPENRIVVDYHGTDDLYLLGSVVLDTGYVFTPGEAAAHIGWKGPRAGTMLKYKTLADALAAPSRPNREGVVISTRGGGRMVKLKQEDYLRLHKIVFGLSERSTWEALGSGKGVDDLLEPLPDEFHQWTREVAHRLIDTAVVREGRLKRRYRGYVALMEDLISNPDVVTPTDPRGQQKLFAEVVRDDPDRWAMFALRAGKDISERIWKDLKPEAGLTPNRAAVEA